MVNILQAVYIATAVMLVMALVRFIGSRRATGEDRAWLAEKARRYFIISGVMGIASIGGYTVLEPPLEPWTLAPGRGAIGIDTLTSHARLVAELGDSLVRLTRLDPDATVDERIPVSERATVRATVLFPDDDLRRLEIFWQDTVRLERAAVLRVRGDSSRWRLESGETLGDPGADGAPRRVLSVSTTAAAGDTSDAPGGSGASSTTP
ncbi:MAG TPA: hypothetical protein VFM71_12720 [Gemmatimonadaceae bacterium]|nr:hypothetical protein [Gemmatimonadaceae bacterium]